jgi:chemotaxis-related protein WspB
MRLLTFTVGAESYGVPSRLVVEVLPLVPARPVPHSAPYLRGVFGYRGSLVPLVDLGLLFLGRPLRERLSTRVIVIEPAPAAPRLGIVAENVVSFATVDDTAAAPAWREAHAPYLGRVLRIDGRTVQLIEPGHLLPTTSTHVPPGAHPPAEGFRDPSPPSPLPDPS